MTNTYTYFENLDSNDPRKLQSRIDKVVSSMKKKYHVIKVEKTIHDKEYIGKSFSGVDLYYPKMCKVSIIYEQKKTVN